MFARALGRRCPRCGSGGIFRGWFHLRVRCPGCGYRFEREAGFFLGAFTINLIVTLGALFLVLISAVLFGAAQEAVPVVPIVIIGLGCAVVLPVVFYPVSITLWAAFDLSADPLELDEIVEAVDAANPEVGVPSGDPTDAPDRPTGETRT